MANKSAMRLLVVDEDDLVSFVSPAAVVWARRQDYLARASHVRIYDDLRHYYMFPTI